MSRQYIPQMQPYFGEEEKQAICEYMDQGGFLTEFNRTEEFERMIAEYTGSKYCVVVNNGTVSLTLAAIAVDIKAGDEVIVPNYTMIATANAVTMIGARPIFVDVEPETLCLDIEKVRAAITSKTRAVMLVSANGRFPKAGVEAFEQLASDFNLILIEDAAQSLGSFYPDGRHIGRAGIIGSFSFSAPKIISTGQGGALITDEESIYKRLRRLKDFGRASGGNDIHDSVGFNFKFTDLQACVGIEQMKKLPNRIIRKKQIWQRYRDNLFHVSKVQFYEHHLEYTSPWFIDIIGEFRDDLATCLQENGVGTRRMYPPVNSQAAYCRKGSYPVSQFVGENGLWLPSFVQLSNDEIDIVCENIIDFYAKHR